MANNEAGAFLNITPDVLKKLDSFDEKLEKIEKHAHTAADALKNGFGKVVIDTTKLENAITSLASKIGALNAVGNSVQNIGNAASGAVAPIHNVTTSLSQTAQLINSLSVSRPYESWNVAQIKAEIDSLNKSLKEGLVTDQSGAQRELTKMEQQAMVDKRNALKDELKIQEASSYEKEKAIDRLRNKQNAATIENIKNAEKEEKVRIAAEKAVDKEIEKDHQQNLKRLSRESKELQKNAILKQKLSEQQIKAYQNRNYRQNTTVQGAIDFSKTAHSLQRQITAIEYLKKARLSLNTTDANYKNTLNQINQAIARHNQALTEAGIKSQQLATRHRNLMDTAGQLSRQLALVFSVSQIEGFISSIAKVRGEFELQQRSLQAILQNKTKADTVFNKTMALALDSPFRAQQLITYTKQLAAYRIESDKLYDTTKRLAEVSAGLGVGMDRLILAYGQVKAAAYLRGSEVRQFTEAGINMYGELQRYFQEINGEAYTTAQIVDMISKRKVTFEDVENIFKRLTDEGGLFYNMQHIQVETLSGKIGKLRDAIDQMKNSIGKENEGIFKGLIDAATVLVQNWDKIVNVGYSLAGVFLMLKTQSLLTGVAMRKVFTAEFAAGGKNALKPLELLKIKFWDLQKGAIALGKSMKAAFVTNLPLLAITAIVSATYKAYDKISLYNDAISKSNEELVKARGLVADIANEYKNLETASNNAKRVQDRNNDYATDIKARRNALQKLIDLANKEGLTFEVKVSEVKEEELDAVFNGVKEQYERFLLDMAIIEKNHAENERNRDWWFFSDAINEDAEDYRKAVLDVLSQSDKLDMAIANVKANYSNLSEASKEYYNIVAAGRKEGESQIDYYSRMYNVMLQINRLNVGTNTGVPQWLKGTNTILKDVSGSFKDVGNQAKEFEKELDRVLREVIANARENGATDIQIQARIDKYAAQQGFDDIKKDLAYQHFGINVSINQDSVDKEISWVDNYLKEFFEKKTYKINLDMTQPIDAKVPFEDFVKKGDEAAKAAKSWEEVGKRIAAIGENVKQIEADSKIANFLNSQSPILNIKSGDMVDVKLILDTISEYKKTQTDLSNALGVNPFEKKGGNTERDIWSERISVLKEMQSRYEKLNQLMGENAAIEQTISAFKGALDFTQMGEVIKPEDIIPTKKGMIDALEKLLKQIPDIPKYAAKRTGLEKEIAELKIGIQQDYLKEQLEKTKKNIEDMFNGLDLHKKLKDAGLSEAEVQQLFPGLAKTLDDVEKGIRNEYEAKRDKNGELSKTDQKDYDEALKKLNQQRIKESQDLVVELTKAYKTQLSDQLQLDRWYYEERAKIQRANLTDDQKVQFNKNLTKQYNEKSDENAWKQFQESDFYIDLFQNLDNVSTKTLIAMREKLADMKEQLKDLQPSQVRTLANNMEKLNEVLAGRNPFKELIPNLKSYIGSLKDRKKHEDDYITALDEQEKVEKRLYGYTKINEDGSKERVIGESEVLAQLEAEHNAIEENTNATEEQKNAVKKKLDDAKDVVRKTEEELAKNKEITDEKKAQVDADRKKLDAANKSLNEIAKYGAEAVDAVSEFTGMLEGFGVEIPEWLTGTTEGLGQMFDGLGSIDLTRPFSIVTGAFKTVAGIGKTIGSLFGIGNKDKKKEREIQRQIKNIEELGKKYDELKEKMEAAWSADDLRTQTKDTVANLDQQIASYQAMIKAEQDKKKTDKDRIKEWQEAIEELEKTKQEILNEERKYMGGIGGEEEYKSAAESFVQAWMDAFNETGNGLKGLEENFDDMINNLFLKQASMRIANKFLEPLFQMIDLAVTEGEEAIAAGFDGDTKVTRQEMDKIIEEAKKQFPQLSEALEQLYNALGLKNNKTAELSSLTQSIQGLTEQTADELAAILESVRFFVAQQTTDISAIRALLDARYSLESEYSDSNPMLVELRAQTGYLEILSDRIDRVFATNANSRGAGLRVYMQ